MRLPISSISSRARASYVLAVSMAIGKNRWFDAMSAYLESLNVAACLAADPASVEMCESAKISGTATSPASGLPFAHGISVAPSGRFPPWVTRPTGSLWAGTWALLMALQIASLSIACRCCLGALKALGHLVTWGRGGPWRRPSYRKRRCEGSILWLQASGQQLFGSLRLYV